MESTEKVTEVTTLRNKNVKFGTAWIALGILNILAYYYQRFWWPNPTVAAFIALFAWILLIGVFFSISEFYPNNRCRAWMMSVLGVVSLFVLVGWWGGTLSSLSEDADILIQIVAICTILIIFGVLMGHLIKEGVWTYWVPIMVGVLIRVLSILVKDYFVSNSVFVIASSLAFILVGVIWIYDIKPKKVPIRTAWAILMVGAMVGAMIFGAIGYTREWSGERANREISAAIDTELPKTADEITMNYTHSTLKTMVYISFIAPKEDVQNWLENGVLSFKKSLEDFYSGEDLGASNSDMSEAIMNHGTNNIADIYSLVFLWDARLMRQWKIDDTAKKYGDICGIEAPGQTPYFVWISEEADGDYLVQILSQRK